MAEESTGWRGVLDGLLGLASDYVSSSVRISVKTNYGPELPVARAALGDGGGSGSGAGGGAGVTGLLGLKAAVIVRNAQGDVIATYGEVPKTEVWRAVLAAALALGLVVLIVRGALK